MLFNRMTFIGIDPTAGNRPLVYAALDVNLQLLALGEGSLDDIVAFTAGQQAAFVAVSAPRRPNIGLMAKEEIRQALIPRPTPGRWVNFRLCEFILRQHNLHIPQTPAVEKKAKNWMRVGFRLFSRLEEVGYAAFPQEGRERQVMEVYPHASYSALLERLPFPKNTLEGRLQRQMVLFDIQLQVPDPMRFFEEITRIRLLRGILPTENLYSTMELDALVGAYTAWLAARDQDKISLVGDPQEGVIVLPVAELKSRYQ
jgi:predicted RNase H-like nuclease